MTATELGGTERQLSRQQWFSVCIFPVKLHSGSTANRPKVRNFS